MTATRRSFGVLAFFPSASSFGVSRSIRSPPLPCHHRVPSRPPACSLRSSDHAGQRGSRSLRNVVTFDQTLPVASVVRLTAASMPRVIGWHPCHRRRSPAASVRPLPAGGNPHAPRAAGIHARWWATASCRRCRRLSPPRVQAVTQSGSSVAGIVPDPAAASMPPGLPPPHHFASALATVAMTRFASSLRAVQTCSKSRRAVSAAIASVFASGSPKWSAKAWKNGKGSHPFGGTPPSCVQSQRAAVSCIWSPFCGLFSFPAGSLRCLPLLAASGFASLWAIDCFELCFAFGMLQMFLIRPVF